MVSKVKSNWGKEAGMTIWLPDLSDEFKKEVSTLFSLSGDELQRFLGEMEGIVHRHLICAEESKKAKDTNKKVRQAAIDIKSQAEKLSEMLYGNAGGMQPYLDSSVSLPLRGNGNMIFLDELTQLLNGVKDGCDHYLEDVYPNIENTSAPTRKEIFTKEIMTFYREFFMEEPIIYLSDWGNDPSKFAILLRISFKEAGDGAEDGSLRKYMSWAKNN